MKRIGMVMVMELCLGKCDFRGFRERGEVLVCPANLTRNQLIDLVLEVFGGDSDGAGDRPLTRGTMRFEHSPVKPQQRGASVRLRVHAPPDRPKRTLGAHGPEL